MVTFFLSDLHQEKTRIFNQFIFKNLGIIYTEKLLAYSKKLNGLKDIMDGITNVFFIDQHIDEKYSIFEKYINIKDIPTIIMVKDLNGIEYYEKLRLKFPESKIYLVHLSQIKHEGDVKKEIHNILQKNNKTAK